MLGIGIQPLRGREAPSLAMARVAYTHTYIHIYIYMYSDNYYVEPHTANKQHLLSVIWSLRVSKELTKPELGLVRTSRFGSLLTIL